MKKLRLAFILLFLFTIEITIYSNSNNSNENIRGKDLNVKLRMIRVNMKMNFEKIELSKVLSKISEYAPIEILASKEISELKIDMNFSENLSLYEIIERIKTTNGLSSKTEEDFILLEKIQYTEEIKYGKVEGRVTELEKKTGIFGIEVYLKYYDNKRVKTDTAGAFVIENIRPGIYTLVVDSKEYIGQVGEISIKSGEVYNKNIEVFKRVDQNSTKKSSKMQVIPCILIMPLHTPLLKVSNNILQDKKYIHFSGKEIEEYNYTYENEFLNPCLNPCSTFPIDINLDSYSVAKEYLNNNKLPPKEKVKVESFINSFEYSYKAPKIDDFELSSTITESPFDKDKRILFLGLKARKIENEQIPISNFTFIVDLSSSISRRGKLPLMKNYIKIFAENMRPTDNITIISYKKYISTVLPPTPGKDKEKIISAIDSLESNDEGYENDTSSVEALDIGYMFAKKNFVKQGNNRIVISTDGDFNTKHTLSDAGDYYTDSSDFGEIIKMIDGYSNRGIFLNILGVDTGNLKDSLLEQFAYTGNGKCHFINDLEQASKILVNRYFETMYTIGKDIKLQVEFNPAVIKSYRLIGYENRVLKTDDYKKDKKSEVIGAGQSVTVLYELTMNDKKEKEVDVLKLKYQNVNLSKEAEKDEVLNLSISYNKISDGENVLTEKTVKNEVIEFANVSDDFRFALSVAKFGEIIRDSAYKGYVSYEQIIDIARNAKGKEYSNERDKLIRFIEMAKTISENNETQY